MEKLALVIISTVFGALITYFFKTVFQSKAIVKSVDESIKKALKTHLLISHKEDPESLIDQKILVYAKEVDYKILQVQTQVKDIIESGNLSKEMLHGIEISVAGIHTELKYLKEKIK